MVRAEARNFVRKGFHKDWYQFTHTHTGRKLKACGIQKASHLDCTMKSLLCLMITIVWIWWRGFSLSRVYQVTFGPLLHGAGSTLRRWAAVFWMKEWEPPNKKNPMLPVANCGSFAGAPMDPSFSEEYCGVTSVKLKIGVLDELVLSSFR